jgi:hypothetical protein
VREVRAPFNIYDDRGSDADLNVVLAWQSGHRPLQRGITYGLDGAYPSRLQPALLRAYEWASTRWHEFLHQPSKISPRTCLVAEPQSASTAKRSISSLDMAPTPKRQALSQVINNSLIQLTDNTTVNTPLNRAALHKTAANTKANTSLHCQEQKDHGITDYIYINNEYRLVICKLCQAATVPGRGLREHFHRTHQFTGKLLRQITEHCAVLQLQDPLTAKLPPDGSVPESAILVQRGYSCSHCRYLTISRKMMRVHWGAKLHNVNKRPQWTEVWLQTWSRMRPQYWIVNPSNITM